jgi:hypothetical protein
MTESFVEENIDTVAPSATVSLPESFGSLKIDFSSVVSVSELSQDTFTYVLKDSTENVIASGSLADAVSLDVYTETPTTNAEKIRIRKAVKRHHAEQLAIVNKKLKKNLVEGLIFSFLGILILFIEAILYIKFENMYLDTILAVIGWLFMWDGLEVMLSTRHDLKRKKIRCMRMIDAKVHVRKYSRKIQRQYKFGEFEEYDEDEE